MAQSNEDLEKFIKNADLNPDPNEVIETFLPKLQGSRGEGWDTAFRTLLMKLSFAYNKRNFPTEENKARLSKELIRLYQGDPKPDDSRAGELLRALTKYGDNQIAKPFILKLMMGPIEKERTEILRVLGAPGGISGPEIFDLVKQLGDSGIINSEGRTTMLARVDRERALPEILKELKTTNDKNLFVYSAWALQTYYNKAENFKFIVPRLQEFGLASDGIVMNKSFKGGSGIGWVNADLFSEYVENAPPSEVKRAFEIMTKETQLCKPSTVPMLSRMMKRTDPEIRRMAAKGLRRASEFSRSDAVAIKAALLAGFESETDAQVKAGINSELQSMERHEKAWDEMLKRTGQK